MSSKRHERRASSVSVLDRLEVIRYKDQWEDYKKKLSRLLLA